MPFSEEYFRLFDEAPALRDRAAQKYLLATSDARVSERLLRCIWYDRLFDEGKLASSDGRKITVHSPGTWNLESGPDFIRADITISDKRQKGDVELHIKPAGWHLHGHRNDPRYDRVILHVVLSSQGPSQPALSRHGVEIPEVALWEYLTDNMKVLKCALRPEEYPYKSMRNYGRCRGILEQMPPQVGMRLLLLGGDARMIVKHRRFFYEAERSELDQIAYAAMLEGMGYKAYTKQFGQLARMLPYARLRECVLSAPARSANEGVALTQALLLGAAGLLGGAARGENPSYSPEAQEYITRAMELWRERGPAGLDGGGITWKAPAVRPANLPERRIAGISHMLARTYEDGVFSSILARLSSGDARRSLRGCLDLIMTDDDFWSYRYTMRGRKLAKPVAILGRDRALTIVVNFFVPLGLLNARLRSLEEQEEFVHRFYCGLPSLPKNNITRLMEYRMFGSLPKDRTARSARTQQGLLQIFADWCSEDPSCENCAVLAGLQSGYIRDRILSDR